MEGSSEQSSSSKRKQLHPKKQILELIPLQANNDPAEKPPINFLQEKLKIPIGNVKDTKTDKTLELPISNEISSLTELKPVTNPNEEDKNSSEVSSAHLDEIPIINIEKIKFSIKQKLEIAEHSSALNSEPAKRVLLSRRNRIAAQKSRKFYADPALHTTILRNTHKMIDNNKNKCSNTVMDINNLIKGKTIEPRQTTLKRKLIEKRKTRVQNRKLLVPAKETDDTTKVKGKKNIDGAATENNMKSSTLDKMKSDDNGKWLFKKLLFVPGISNATLQTNKTVASATEVPKSVSEINEAAKKLSTCNLNETEINLQEDDYVACLQTVKPSTVSTIKAIASIKSLEETSPEKLREASENMLEYNIDMINLINKLSLKTNATIGAPPANISLTKLEDALVFALGKKPRTITIIRRPKDTTGIIPKPSINYGDRLDFALDNALGNDSKLLPFVKKLINSSVSNFTKVIPTKNNLDMKYTKSYNLECTHVKLFDTRSNVEKTSSDTRDQNIDSINVLGHFSGANSTSIAKPQEANLVNKNNMNIMEDLETIIAKPTPVYRKHIINTRMTKPIILKRLIKGDSITSGTALKEVIQKLPKNQIQIQSVQNSTVAIKKPDTFSHNNLKNAFGINPYRPLFVKRSLKTTKPIETSDKSPTKQLSIICPVQFVGTYKRPSVNPRPIIVKRLVKTPHEQTSQNSGKQENIVEEALNVTIGKPVPEIVKKSHLNTSDLNNKQTMEKLENIKRKLTESKKISRLGFLEAKSKIPVAAETLPIKRPKTMTPLENKMNSVSLEFVKHNLKMANDEDKTIADFSSLQSNIKAILESDVYKQINSPDTSSSMKLDETQLNKNHEIKGLPNFVLMHEMIESVLKSPGYQEMLTFAKDPKHSPSSDEASPVKQPTETTPSLDPDAIDLTTLKMSSTVPDTLLPLLDKEEAEEVYDRYLIENIWNEKKKQGITIFDKKDKK